MLLFKLYTNINWGVTAAPTALGMLVGWVYVMTSQLMAASNDFKEKNGLHCVARAKKNMKNTKETVYHCYVFQV